MNASNVRLKIDAALPRLQRASAVLTCLAAAWENGVETDFDAVAIAVRDLIDDAAESLESAKLRDADSEDEATSSDSPAS